MSDTDRRSHRLTALIEAAAIGIPDDVKGSSVICFCVVASGQDPSETIKSELKIKVGNDLGKPLQPKEIIFVPDLPKTRNNKVMRRIIKSSFLGDQIGDTSSLVNPGTIEWIRKAGEK